jgi:hypothetical protein
VPRLNLDIFGDDTVDAAIPAERQPDTPSPQTPASEGQDTVIKKRIHRGSPAVRFIPVGFHEKHLQLLEDAVHELRKKGRYNASKSGIIRLLIEKHARELKAIWLEADST